MTRHTWVSTLDDLWQPGNGLLFLGPMVSTLGGIPGCPGVTVGKPYLL